MSVGAGGAGAQTAVGMASDVRLTVSRKICTGAFLDCVRSGRDSSNFNNGDNDCGLILSTFT